MPDDRIKFSELSGVLTIDNNDIIAAAVQNGASETGFASAKITIGQLSTKVAEGTTFSNLTTQNKYIVPAINEIKELISSIPQFDVQVVQTLPQTGITGTVYLVPSPEGSSPNLYEEYLWVSNQWEKLGSASVDLSNYYNKTQVNGLLADVFSASESYSVGDLVIYSDYLYKCIESTSGSWDSTKWSIVKLSYEIPRELGDLDNVNITTPTHGQALVYDNPSGKWINGSVGGSAESTSYDNTESGLSATNVQEAIDELEENIEGITEPQKTVSGSVVTFSDSLPNSPLLACKASIEATQSGSGTPSPDNPRPITGFSEVVITNNGKNWINLPDEVRVNRGVTYTINNGVITLSGTATSPYADYTFNFAGKRGTTYFVSGGVSADIYIRNTHYNKNDTGNGFSFVSDGESSIFYIRVLNGIDATGIVIKPQIEVGEAKTAYEPFKGSTHTIPLGQTVGRGVLNVTTGELTITHGYTTFNGSEAWQIHGSIASWFYLDNFNLNSFVDSSLDNFADANLFLQDKYSNVSGLTANKFAIGSPDGTIKRLVIKDTRYTSLADFKNSLQSTPVQLVFKLATPITVQLTPEEILTITGENNISANSGDIEATYRTPFYVSANTTSYDNSTSGLAATNVQAAIDEVNTSLADKADTAELATVATSGNYSDLTGIPTINSGVVTLDSIIVTGFITGSGNYVTCTIPLLNMATSATLTNVGEIVLFTNSGRVDNAVQLEQSSIVGISHYGITVEFRLRSTQTANRVCAVSVVSDLTFTLNP